MSILSEVSQIYNYIKNVHFHKILENRRCIQKDIHECVGTRWGRKRPEGVITKVMRNLNGIDGFISLSVVIASWMCMYVTMYSIKNVSQVLLAVFQLDHNKGLRQISLQLPALSSSPFSQIRISLLGLFLP